MNTQHTPGPWVTATSIAVVPGYVAIIRSDGKIVALVPVEDEWEANARLIAAAPELLAVLQAVERFNTPLPHGLLEQARAAIAKATSPA